MILHQVSNSLGNYNYNAYIYKDTVWEPHFHGNYELVYSAEGITEIFVNGVSEKLLPKELMLVSPYAIHSLNISKNTKTWVGVFSKDFIRDFAQKYRFANFPKFRCSEKIEKFLSENLFENKTPEHYMHTACFYLVCGQCLENGSGATVNCDADFMERTVSYIAENIENNITMENVANELNYEYHYFSSLFHSCFSMNFKKFINILRFEQACGMLADKNTSITEVSNRCGFGSIRNFNRIFREFSGKSPSEYRNF